MCIRDRIKTGKVSWYTPLSGVVPVSVQVQEEGGEGESNSFTVTGTPVSYTHLDVYKRQGSSWWNQLQPHPEALQT